MRSDVGADYGSWSGQLVGVGVTPRCAPVRGGSSDRECYWWSSKRRTAPVNGGGREFYVVESFRGGGLTEGPGVCCEIVPPKTGGRDEHLLRGWEGLLEVGVQ